MEEFIPYPSQRKPAYKSKITRTDGYREV